jgi:YgiT-type zinc finger domain-containing protein
MECVICKMGTTFKGKTTYTIDKQKSLLVFRDVEADVCNNCGEAYFSLETTKKLQQLVSEALKKGAEFEVVKM